MVVEPFDAAHTPKFTTQIAELKDALEMMFEQLDRINILYREVAPTAPKMLCHYLERKSYAKALDLLKTL